MRVLAVDLGASSIRVAAVDLGQSPPTLDVLHRWAHKPVEHADGSLRWDWPRIVSEVVDGLSKGLDSGPVASIGIDTWGVDYGLLDAGGRLISDPYCYRDERTSGWRDVVDRIGAEHLYSNTGIQLMAPNTIFQLAVHDREELERAETFLMLPELLVHELTGAVTGEKTSAGTSSLVDVKDQTWSADLLARIDVDPALFPPIAQPTTAVGQWREVPVHLVGGHDTASAVVALPGPVSEDAAFISSGTWLLVGAERSATDTSERARAANFSNEPGALSGVRFLKNIMGLWMLEQCRLGWPDEPLEALLDAAERVPAGGPVVDATHERFLAPDNMDAEVRAAAGIDDEASHEVVTRCILDSLAISTAEVIDELGDFIGTPVSEVNVVGGGSRNQLLNNLIEESAGVPVNVGSPEATALGNAMVQGLALGVFSDLDDARSAITR